MIRLGERQELVIVKQVEFGVYLAVSFEDAAEHILLPIKQVPEGSKVGDKLDVFVYRDSRDRMIATVKEPKLKLGEVAELKVAQVGKYGAFLDWGLEKDLMLPFKQQRGKVVQGADVLVSLYIDKSNRLCATMNVYKELRTDSPYKSGDRVKGRVYELSDNFGAFVAVGKDVEARVLSVREDGKLTLGIREKTSVQMGQDAEKILALLDSYEGALPFNDKAAPEVIAHETGMSKNEFKRAVGRLLKEGRIEIGEKTIRRKS